MISGSRLESAVDDVGVVVLFARSECEIGLKEVVLSIIVSHKTTEIQVVFDILTFP